jgi:hypothetical protein
VNIGGIGNQTGSPNGQPFFTLDSDKPTRLDVRDCIGGPCLDDRDNVQDNGFRLVK